MCCVVPPGPDLPYLGKSKQPVFAAVMLHLISNVRSGDSRELQKSPKEECVHRPDGHSENHKKNCAAQPGAKKKCSIWRGRLKVVRGRWLDWRAFFDFNYSIERYGIRNADLFGMSETSELILAK